MCSATRAPARDQIIEPGLLARLHQPQMAFGQGDIARARQEAEDTGNESSASGGDRPRVPLARDAVEDDPGDGDIIAEARETVDDGRRRGRLSPRIDDEDDRQPRHGGDIGGRAGPVGGPVEQPHHPLADEHLAACRGGGKGPAQGRIAHRPAIEIAARAAAGGGVEGRIDIVGTNLEGGNSHSPLGEGAKQAEGHRRLAAPRGRGGDDEPARRAHGCVDSAMRLTSVSTTNGWSFRWLALMKAISGLAWAALSTCSSMRRRRTPAERK